MPFIKGQEIKVGDKVYARFFGDKLLTVKSVEKVSSGFPHFICSLGRSEYLIPKIHLSIKSIVC